jgi:hypothetical protein
MVGKGLIADQIRNMYKVFRQKCDLDREMPPYNCELFQAPVPKSGQMRLF